MAGGEVQVSFVAPSQMRSVQPIMSNCQFSVIVLFIFSMPSKVIFILIEFMFAGISMFWALLKLILVLG